MHKNSVESKFEFTPRQMRLDVKTIWRPGEQYPRVRWTFVRKKNSLLWGRNVKIIAVRSHEHISPSLANDEI